MTRPMILIVALLATLILAAGCGGNTEEQAAPAESTTTGTAAESAAETVATHDCDGGCGMKDVPEADMTELHGKWYCSGCAKKAEEEHDHG